MHSWFAKITLPMFFSTALYVGVNRSMVSRSRCRNSKEFTRVLERCTKR